MDSQERVSFAISQNKDAPIFTFPKLYGLGDFEVKYGEDNCTIMLQDREKQLYIQKAAKLSTEIPANEVDWERNIQTALDAWKPCDDRPPTEMEAKALEVLSMSPQAQRDFIRHITAGIAEQAQEQARVDAEKASEQAQTLDEKFQPPADVGPPVTQPQQEPPIPASFEQLGAEADQAAENSKAVQAALAGQDADIQANAEDFKATPAFEEGGGEDVIEEAPGQKEVGMPPQPTE